MPKVSVIIPVFNAETTLERCVKSVLTQSFADFELILVDDGSRDGSLGICRQMAETDNRVRILSQDNQGVSKARNAGMDAAEGEYITFVDADDWVDAEYIASFFATGNAAPQNIVLQSVKKEKVGTATETITLADAEYTDKAQMAQLVLDTCRKDVPVYVWNVLFGRQWLNDNKIRFDESFSVCEDTDFILQCMAKATKVVTTTRANYHYNAPSEEKRYPQDNALDISLKLMKGICRLTEDETTRKAFRDYWMDWGIDGLLTYGKDTDIPMPLIEDFARIYYPHLGESKRKTFRHKAFKMLCRNGQPEKILRTVRLVRNIDNIIKR